MTTNRQLNDLAYTHISRLLVAGRIRPDQRLSETHLAREIGVSRTPVREAIRRLSKEGILRQVPSSGTYLILPGEHDIEEIYDIRESLECYLVKKAVPSMSELDYKRIRKKFSIMKQAVEQMKQSGVPYLAGLPLRRFLRADGEFHRHLLEAADNRSALRILDDANMRSCVFGIRSHRRDSEHLTRVMSVHQRLMHSAIKGNVAATVHWLRIHIQESRHGALAAIRNFPPAEE